jgi:pimeloyl-ACP methyl ester carboxylesterase
MDLSLKEIVLIAIAIGVVGSIIFTTVGIAVFNYLHNVSKRRLPKDANSWVEISDSKIHYRIDGKGPALVLIHGLGASLFIWRLVSDRLAQNFTVVTLDLPGFGLSSKDSSLDYGLDSQTRRIVEVLDALKIEEATLVGSSMGGALALWLARENPKRFKNVVALAPATSPSLVPRFVLPFNNALKNIAPLVLRTMNTHTMKLMASLVLYNRSLLTEETINAYLRPYLEDKESINTFWRAIELVRDRRLPNEFDKVTSRVLVLWGERDRVVPRRCISELINILPYAEFRTHKECGHHPMEDQPDWVLGECERFLRVKNP